MIYTSYYGKLKKIPKTIEPIAISRSIPKGLFIFSCEELMPPKELLSWWKNSKQNEQNKADYIADYCLQLEKLDVKKIVKQLEKMSCGKDIVLLCYEKSEDFCHRHLVRKWLTVNGYECQEWNE